MLSIYLEGIECMRPKKETAMIELGGIIILFSLSGCGSTGTNGLQGPPGQNGTSIGMYNNAATSNECYNGGTDLTFFTDLYNTGVFEGNDAIISKSTICNGLNGTSSTIEVSNANIEECSDGGLVLTTTVGNNSQTNTICNGATGPEGEQGPPGANAANVTMIQFCSNYNTDSFPEFGICSNNSLYAVYWDNKNSWLAEIVPGYYESTSTNVPCNFTVEENCVVKDN